MSDLEPDDRAPQPPSLALAHAIDRLASGDVDRLVVSRLDHLARTPEELASLLQAVTDSHAALVVLDRNLDTAALRDPVKPDQLLLRPPEQPRRVPETLDTRAIDIHIASMLNEGLTPEDIAAALNDEPVPPPEGAQWGSTKVQAAVRRREHAHHSERADA